MKRSLLLSYLAVGLLLVAALADVAAAGSISTYSLLYCFFFLTSLSQLFCWLTFFVQLNFCCLATSSPCLALWLILIAACEVLVLILKALTTLFSLLIALPTARTLRPITTSLTTLTTLSLVQELVLWPALLTLLLVFKVSTLMTIVFSISWRLAANTWIVESF